MALRGDYLLGIRGEFAVDGALQSGFRVYVIEDAGRGINLKQHDVEETIKEMRSSGVCVVKSDELDRI